MSTNGKMQFPSRGAGFPVTVSVRFTGMPLAHTSQRRSGVWNRFWPQRCLGTQMVLPVKSGSFHLEAVTSALAARRAGTRTMGYW